MPGLLKLKRATLEYVELVGGVPEFPLYPNFRGPKESVESDLEIRIPLRTLTQYVAVVSSLSNIPVGETGT